MATLVLLGGGPLALAAENGSAPSKRGPVVPATVTSSAPVIDGRLDDACWATAARLEGFFPPDVTDPVPEETVGLVCITDSAIYVGMICRDRTPDDTVAQETRRNGDIWDDDYVEVSLDTWHQHQDMYTFRV